MISRAILRVDMGFYIGILLRLLLKAVYGIHVLWSTNDIDIVCSAQGAQQDGCDSFLAGFVSAGGPAHRALMLKTEGRIAKREGPAFQ